MLSKAALRSLLLVSLLGLFITSPSSHASAGTNVWTSLGPEGGDIYALAIDPVTPTTLYAGTFSGNVFKSTNGGGTWNTVNISLTTATVRTLVIDPATPTTLYAVASWVGKGGGSVAVGMFKSMDGGGAWSALNTGFTNTLVSTLVIDPATPTTLYMGTSGAGVFKSTNGGGTWSAMNTGLISTTVVESLAIDPATPSTLYVGTYGGGVFKSTNGGGTWSAMNTGLTETWGFTLAIDPITPTILYAGTLNGGVFKSTDGGGNWVSTGLTNTYVYAVAVDPATPTTLYAGTEVGVFKSTNGGGNWNTINTGLAAIRVRVLAIHPATPTILYTGTGDGVFKSTNGGGNWNAVNSGLTNTYIYSMAIDPTTPTTLYAGTNRNVFKSTIGSGTWIAVNTGLTPTYVSDLVIDPATLTTLYAGTYGGVFKSTNGGGNWSAASTGLTNTNVGPLAIDPTTPAILYAGTYGGVFKSTNGGGNWSAVNTGLTNTNVGSLAIDPATPTILYAGTYGGVFKSTNGGGNWIAASAGLTNTNVGSLAIDPTTPTTLYAGTQNGGVFKSTNGGGNWNAVNTGLPQTYVSDLVIDPVTPTTLYVGTQNGGVFKSTNGGGTWSAINAGLTNASISTLAIDPAKPSTLYAGTYGGGVFVLRQRSALQVNTPNDFVDPVPGDGICGAGGFCSLRAAVMEANALPDQDSISVPAGDYALTLGGLTITDTVLLNGAGQDQTIIRGSAAITTSPVVFLRRASAKLANLTIRDGAGGGVTVDTIMYDGVNVLLDHVTVFNNKGPGFGGIAFGMFGKLTLNHSQVISNTAGHWINGSGYGGGFNVGDFSTVILNDSVVAGNTATGGGGGIASFGGWVDVDNSIIADNTALEDGGGIMMRQGGYGAVRLVNSTVSGNSARYGGGLISQIDGRIEITNTTIAHNFAGVAGGGLATMPFTHTQSLTQVQVYSAGVISFTNTLVADNLAPLGTDCYRDTGQLISSGHNLIGTTAGCVITSTATDLVNLSALLGPLQANGGDTSTHALLPGSPAINAGDNATCPATDQRGVPRPYGPACDIGAYEWVKTSPIYLPLIMRNYAAPIPLQADFIAAPTLGSMPLTVTFANTSSGTYTASLWDFGDGVTSTQQNPTRTYPLTGTYTVTLTVANATETSTLVRPNYITVTAPDTHIPVSSVLIPFDANVTDLGGPSSWAGNYGKTPEIIVASNGVELDVLAQDYNAGTAWKAVLLHIAPGSTGYQITQALTDTPMLDRVMGLAIDNAGNRYYATGVDESAVVNPTYPPLNTYRSNIVRVIKLNPAGVVQFNIDLDTARHAYDTGAEMIINPMVAATSRLAVGGNEIALVHGINTAPDWNINGARHQKALSTRLDAATGAVTRVSSVWVSHSFDQRLLYDGAGIIEHHLGDAYPRYIVFGRNHTSYPLFQIKGALGDNNTRTRLGNLALIENDPAYKYIALFATENSASTGNTINGPRNLAIVRVKGSDNSLDPSLPDALTVSSVGTQYTNRLRWLTQYSASSNRHAERPKLIGLGADQYVVLWEEWLNTGSYSDTFNGVYGMVIDANGTILHATTLITAAHHLPRGDDAFLLDGRAAWLTGNAVEQKLYIHFVDATLNYQMVTLD